MQNAIIPQSVLDQVKLNKYLKQFDSNSKAYRIPILYENIVVGFYSPHETTYNNKKYWRSGVIFILPNYRSKGLASKTLRQFFSDKQYAVSLIDKTNIPSQRLFESLGFKRDAEIIGKISGQPTWIYVKEPSEFKPKYLVW